MKKIFFAVVALAAMSSCAKENTVMEAPRQAIAFGDVFVDNATRADYSSSLIKQFNVYGTVSANGNTVTLFNSDGNAGAVVSSEGKAYGVAWSCSESEYWIPGANYQFEAVVDGTINNGEIAYTIGANPDTDGINDLLYAKKEVNNASATQGLVEFNFTHLLSKVGFSFTNGVTDNNAYTFNVKDVSFTGHDTDGTYTISTEKWDNNVTASATALSFGAAGAVVDATKVYAPTTHQIIPGNQTLAITITYDIVYNNKIMSEGVTTTKELTYEFKKNKVYNIAVVLPAPGNAIQFSVAETNGVAGWVDGGEAEVK